MWKNNTIYTWKFNSKKDRSELWYTIALSLIIWLVVVWFLTKQYWMSFIVLLIAWVSFFVENNTEDIIEVKIKDLWIKIASTFYNFSSIKNYTIIYDWDNAIFLRLQLDRKGIPFLNLYIDNEIAKDIIEILPNFIKENTKWELTFIEKIIYYLKL